MSARESKMSEAKDIEVKVRTFSNNLGDSIVQITDPDGKTRDLSVPKLRPINDLVYLIRDPEQKWSTGVDGARGRIFLPETHRTWANTATVVAVGPGRWTMLGHFVETTLKPGMRVYIPAHGGRSTRVMNDDYLTMREGEVLGVAQE